MLKLIDDRVLLRKDESTSTTTKGGIILPGQVKNSTVEGIVVETGPGRIIGNGTIMPTGVKKGDRVLFDDFGIIAEVIIDDEKLFMVRIGSIHCIFPKVSK